MAKITHPGMKRGRDVPKSNQPEAKTFVVDDMTGANEAPVEPSIDDRLAEFEGGQKEAVEPVAPAETSMTKPNKPEINITKSLEKLIFMGRHSKVLEFADHKFEISTLTHKENNEIVNELMGFGEAADLFTIRILTLAYSLRSIDGINLADIEVDGEFESTLDKQMAIVDHLQLSLVERLYAAYEALVKEADEVVYGENVKN